MVKPDKIISVRKYKIGYEIRTKEFYEDNKEQTPHRIKSAYTSDGYYIGDSKRAYRLIVTRGIKPELASSDNKVCSIGFCEKEQKWYGWSHRAIFGFGIGDVVKEGDCTAMSGYTDEYLKENPEADKSLPVGFIAKTDEDARRMAIAFADSVS